MPQPDLPRLYQQSWEVEQPPVVLIHGIMGSRLEDSETGREVWYGNLGRLAFSDYRNVALEIDPVSLEPKPSSLVPSTLAEQAAGKDFYGSITRTLEQAGQYTRARPGEPQKRGSRSYYVFLYDWRQDNVKSAQQLYRFIDQIRHDYSNPQLKVDLIAHSMGGLIARYFLRYGKSDYDSLMLEPGDGIVTKASLLARESLDSSVTRHRFIDFPLDYPLFLCEKHDALTGNETFQDNLLHALLSLDPQTRP
jgi:pimeloyl-ACP methyl ester carboxylesterase